MVSGLLQHLHPLWRSTIQPTHPEHLCIAFLLGGISRRDKALPFSTCSNGLPDDCMEKSNS